MAAGRRIARAILSHGRGSSKQNAGLYLSGSQVFQEMMDKAIDVVLGQRESVVMHVLFADGPVNQVLRRLLHEIEHDGSLAEADVLVAYHCRPPTPAIPAAVRAAHHARIAAAVGNRHRSVAPLDGEMIVHKEIGSLGVADLIEAFGGERFLNSGL